MQNNYALLGLNYGVDLDTVKKTYRKLVKQCHPDLNKKDPAAALKFHQLTGAYDAICESFTSKSPSTSIKLHPTDRSRYHRSESTATKKTIELTMTAVYIGGSYGPVSGVTYEIPRGYDNGDTFVYENPSGGTYELTVKYIRREGFDWVRKDLYTKMTVDRWQARRKRKYKVPNHPAPFGCEISFGSSLMDGDVVCFPGLGLPSDDGTKGNLYVTISFVKIAGTTIAGQIIMALFFVYLGYLIIHW